LRYRKAKPFVFRLIFLRLDKIILKVHNLKVKSHTRAAQMAAIQVAKPRKGPAAWETGPKNRAKLLRDGFQSPFCPRAKKDLWEIAPTRSPVPGFFREIAANQTKPRPLAAAWKLK
jgi:hypothetical protein